MSTEIIDKHLIEIIDIAGIKHTLFRYQKMRDTLTNVMNELEDRNKASVLSDIVHFMNLTIDGIKKYGEKHNLHH